jgi:uncharacterized protein YerC
MGISQNLQFASLDDLYLDPRNPRLGHHITEHELKQTEIREKMGSWNLEELGHSFMENGQFWTQEALICVREKLRGIGDALVVVEGNRRLAALMFLRDALSGKSSDRAWREIVKGRKVPASLFERIPYLIADDRESVQAFLGFRHVTGIAEWKPAEKAEFIARMIEAGKSYDEVRKKIGARMDTVRRNYISYRLLLQIEETGAVPREDLEDRFSVMFLTLRTEGAQKYLNIDIAAPPEKARQPVPKKHLAALKNFALWLFGNSEDDRDPLFTDSRQADRFGAVLQSPEAVKYLEESSKPDLEVAAKLSGADEVVLVKLIDEASENLELALSRVHHIAKTGRDIERATRRLGSNAKQLLSFFPKVKNLICSEE